MIDDGMTRRGVLRAVGSAVAASGVAGTAESTSTDVRVNVGYTSEYDGTIASDVGSAAHRDFAFGAETVTIDRADVPELRERPEVRYVERNRAVGTQTATPDGEPGSVVGTPDTTDAAVAPPADGAEDGAAVAVIDTGIDSTHPALEANTGHGEAFVDCGEGSSRCGAEWDDDQGHGTRCAGIVRSFEDVGSVSATPTLHAVKVLDGGGAGTYSDVAAGIEFVADRGWDVANLSFASDHSSLVEDAVRHAAAAGVFLVAAAGNGGPCSGCVSYPAADPSVVAVSAVDADGELAGFSSTGSAVELAAHGTGVRTTSAGGGYGTFSGTSMAAPHVAGAAARLMAHGLSDTEARARLRATAQDVGLSDRESGSGLLDAAAALDVGTDVDSAAARGRPSGGRRYDVASE